jgi:hypothetical protein
MRLVRRRPCNVSAGENHWRLVMEHVQSLLSRKIEWQRKPAKAGEWYAVVEGALCELTMNDFPDEPMYTVAIHGQTLDLDDLPSGWVVPHRS